MDIHKSGSLSLAAVLATSLITFSSFAQAPGTATSLVGNADEFTLGRSVSVSRWCRPSRQLCRCRAPSQWTRTTHNPPVNVGTALLLTDGTVIAHEESDLTGNVATNRWYKLTPDINGSYINGTWTQIASMASDYGPLFFASSVLPDGRVVVEGGEYNQFGSGFTNKGAIYDPVANTWTTVSPPTGWSAIGDASSIVLSSGQMILANAITRQAALFNPSNLTWTPTGSGKFDINDEETWTLLPNGKVLTVDCYVQSYQSNGRNYELYDPVSGTWSVAGTTPVQLWDSAANCGGQGNASFEIGPALLLPNGTVFATGANRCAAAHTAVYNTNSGTWTAGPDFPGNLGIADGPAALEPNGKMLMMASPGIFQTGSMFFEWDGTSLTQVAGPPNAPNRSCSKDTCCRFPPGRSCTLITPPMLKSSLPRRATTTGCHRRI